MAQAKLKSPGSIPETPSASARWDPGTIRPEAVDVLVRVAAALGGPGDNIAKMQAVLEVARELCGGLSASLFELEADGATVHVVARAGIWTSGRGRGRGIHAAAASGEPVVTDALADPGYFSGSARANGVRARATIPAGSRHPVRQVLTVNASEADFFTREKLDLLQSIADALASLVDNVRLREQERTRLRELEALNRTAAIFAGSGSLEERIARVLRELAGIAGDWVTLRVLDDQSKEMRLAGSTRLGSQGTISKLWGLGGTAFATKRPAVENDYENWSRAHQPAGVVVRSRAAFPVLVGGAPVAVLTVSSRKRQYFSDSRVRVLSTLAAGIGPYLERARLEEAGRERERALTQALKKLQTAQRRLVQSGRLAALGELASGLARAMNTPLTGILGHARALVRRDTDTTTRRSAELLQAEAERLEQVVQRLLSFAHEQRPERRPVSVNECLTRMLELRSHDLSANEIEVTVDLDPELPLVMGDAGQIEQAFLSLIGNAHQAMADAHGRGKLGIRSRRLEEAVQVTFTDDGPGIPAADIGGVFDPFFSTNGVSGRAGLGLSTCAVIVEEHGGTVWAKSPRRKGCIFGLELPVADPEPASRASESLTARESEVLGLIAQGRSNQEIGNEFGITLYTTKTHVASILRKLRAPNRTSAARVARELNIIG